MSRDSADKGSEKDVDFPSPPNEYWTVKIDLYGWLDGRYDMPLMRMDKVISRKDPSKFTGVYVFARTPELEAAVKEFWNPTTPENKMLVKLIQSQKRGRHLKLAIEK
jgi:hypothetical protein